MWHYSLLYLRGTVKCIANAFFMFGCDNAMPCFCVAHHLQTPKLEGADPHMFEVLPAHDVLRRHKGTLYENETRICVNPLSWRTRTSDGGGLKVPASKNYGSKPILALWRNALYLSMMAPATPQARLNASSPTLATGIASARCDEDGFLRLDPLPTGAYIAGNALPRGALESASVPVSISVIYMCLCLCLYICLCLCVIFVLKLLRLTYILCVHCTLL